MNFIKICLDFLRNEEVKKLKKELKTTDNYCSKLSTKIEDMEKRLEELHYLYIKEKYKSINPIKINSVVMLGETFYNRKKGKVVGYVESDEELKYRIMLETENKTITVYRNSCKREVISYE